MLLVPHNNSIWVSLAIALTITFLFFEFQNERESIRELSHCIMVIICAFLVSYVRFYFEWSNKLWP
uniref:Uncharacterized protein n=1 Tax=Rhizophagus irregularis (strain DAOM 181602 / DAOM 197198 / MUCL 43194) TaxID=747089 RepID=U9U944_RHIID